MSSRARMRYRSFPVVSFRSHFSKTAVFSTLYPMGDMYPIGNNLSTKNYLTPIQALMHGNPAMVNPMARFGSRNVKRRDSAIILRRFFYCLKIHLAGCAREPKGSPVPCGRSTNAFPACAGMNRTAGRIRLGPYCVPRVRGDEPAPHPDLVQVIRRTFSTIYCEGTRIF